jgi:hypothetical protein
MKLKKFWGAARRFLLLEIDNLEKLPKLLVLFLGGALLFGILTAIRQFWKDQGTQVALDQILISLIPEILGSALVYWVLDSSIQQLYGISELPELPLPLFMKDIVQARQIRILETFTSLVTTKHLTKFYQSVQAALQSQDATIEILMIHPNSEGAKQRTEELTDVLDVPDEIQKTLARFYEMQEHLSKVSGEGNFEVRLYDASPSIAMHQWDSYAYVSFYPVGQRADKAPNLKVSIKTTFGQFITQKFDELWHQESTIPLKAHMLMTVLLEDGEPRLSYAFRLTDCQSTSYYLSCHFGDKFGNFMKLRSSDRAIFQVIADGKQRQARCQQVSESSEKQSALEKLQAKYGWNDEQVNQKINLDPVIYLVEVLG